MSDQTPRTQAEADMLLKRAEKLINNTGPSNTQCLEWMRDYVIYLSRPAADSAGSEGEWRLDHDSHNPEGLPWAVEAPIGSGKLRRFGRFLRRDEAESLRNFLNALSARSDAATQDALREIERFVERVNHRAEAEMMRTGTLEGAHHRGIEAELETLRAALNQDGGQG